LDRLKERHLPIDKLAAEISKVDGLTIDEKSLAEILNHNTVATAYLLAAAKLDDDFKKNLSPTEFGNVNELSRCFSNSVCLQERQDYSKIPGYDSVDLPPFIKHVLISLVKQAFSKN
jgi:hypothetical protein